MTGMQPEKNICEDLVAHDRFDSDYVCNHSDDSGRYSYAAQPGMCRWNCEKLAEALSPVLPAARSRGELDVFDREYDRCAPETARVSAVRVTECSG